MTTAGATIAGATSHAPVSDTIPSTLKEVCLQPRSASLVTSFHVAMILAALAANPITSLAQQATGTIIGVVQDASGSQIPNAAVSLSHSATGTTRMVRTNDRGEFT